MAGMKKSNLRPSMDTIEVHSVSSAGEAAREAALKVTSILARYIDTSVLFLVSGGSALPVLSYIDGNAIGDHLTIGVLDDRFSMDPSVNNFLALTKTTFYEFAVAKNAAVISSVPAAGESMSDTADRLDRDMKAWLSAHPGGHTVITQGMGPDGHTAGIMPYPEEPETFRATFMDTERLMTGYDAGARTQVPLRITSTIPFLRLIDDSILYACGEAKREPLRRAVSPDGNLWETPIRVIREMKHVALYTDIVL
jgi:6-phosphogluconolactonase/glucosamine-6-phosphate isomerase/deaminase